MYSMFKNSNYKNPNYFSINYVVSIYNRCLFAKCIIKVFSNLFVFTFGIENIRLVLKLYLSLSLCAGSRPASLCWSLNQDKTDLVVISSRFHPTPDIGHITVGSECIAPCDSVRNLGVQFDSIFSFEEHIKNICKSSFHHLRNIAKIRMYLSQDTCEILVHAFISSKLDHCNSLLHGLPKYLLARLQAVHIAAARVVTLTPKHGHITPILINLHWLPVEFRITFKVLLLVYKALHGLAPSYISDLLNFKTYSRSLRSSCKEYLVVPRSRLKTYGDRAFSIAGPKSWNDLPLEIRKCVSVATFKQSLKTFLFKLAYRL